MNDKADFSTNVTNVVKKARQKMGWILRSFHNWKMYFMKHMLKNLVTPHVDYNSQLWMPIECNEIEKIEKIKRDFFRNIPALWGLNYWDQMNMMNMLSLQHRLERYRFIYFWKVLENLVPNCGLEKVIDLEKSNKEDDWRYPRSTERRQPPGNWTKLSKWTELDFSTAYQQKYEILLELDSMNSKWL